MDLKLPLLHLQTIESTGLLGLTQMDNRNWQTKNNGLTKGLNYQLNKSII